MNYAGKFGSGSPDNFSSAGLNIELAARSGRQQRHHSRRASAVFRRLFAVRRRPDHFGPAAPRGGAELFSRQQASDAALAGGRAARSRCHRGPDRARSIRPGRGHRRGGRRQGGRPCRQDDRQRQRRAQRRHRRAQQRRQRAAERRRADRQRLQPRSGHDRRHHLQPQRRRAPDAERPDLRRQQHLERLAVHPGAGRGQLRRRPGRQDRRHEGRHAGRHHGHPRHRGDSRYLRGRRHGHDLDGRSGRRSGPFGSGLQHQGDLDRNGDQQRPHA